MIRPALFLAAVLLTQPALADGFQAVGERERFIALVEGRELTRLGVALKVSPAGVIEGSAFGTRVHGAWRWQDGYFCRELAYGARDLGANCQLVQQRGDTLRFIADQGRGQHADLRLR